MEIPSYDWRLCTLCQRRYSCHVFLADQSLVSGNDGHEELSNRAIPVKSIVCDHTLCLSCVEKQSGVPSNSSNEYLENPTITCPICRKVNAFSAEEPILSLVTCKRLKKEAHDSTVIPPLSQNLLDCKGTPSEDTNNHNCLVENVGDIESKSNHMKAKSDENMSCPDHEIIDNLESTEKLSDSQPINEENDTQTTTSQLCIFFVDGPHFNSTNVGNVKELILSNHDLPKPYSAVGTLDSEPSSSISYANKPSTKFRDTNDPESKYKLKYEPEILVFDQEPSTQHPLPEYMVINDDTIISLPKDDSEEDLQTSKDCCHGKKEEDDKEQDPSILTNLPGAYVVAGPHFHSTIEDVYSRENDLNENRPEPIVEAYLVLDTGSTYHAHHTESAQIVNATPWVPFHVRNRRWIICGGLTLVFVAIVIVLILELPKATRNQKLTSTVLKVSEQTSVTGLGAPQQLALEWLGKPENAHLSPNKDKNQIIQRYLLATLFYSTNGDNWSNKGSFLSSKQECDWHPEVVRCSENQQIVNITLESNNLSGSIPSEIGKFEKLQVLQLSSNKLSGKIPGELGNLMQVTKLNLGDNSLSGSIPSTLGKLTQVTNLYLYSNPLSGSIPSEFGDLRKLTTLNLWNDTISGTIPSELGKLTLMTNLYLSSNKLSGSIPSDLGELRLLTTLHLFDNALSGSIPSNLGKLTQLTDLQMYINQLNGNIPSELGHLSKITSIYLSYNMLSGTIPNELGKLSQLTNLQMHINQLRGNIPSDFGNLTKLSTLFMGNNVLTGTIPSEMGKLSFMAYLDLSENHLNGTIPIQLGNLEQLVRLFLVNNALFGEIPTEFGKLKKLTELKINGNQLNGTIPEELGNLIMLNRLWLFNNNLSGDIPIEFERLDNLIDLDLSNNQLTGTVPSELNLLPKLILAQLDGNNVISGNVTALQSFCDEPCNILSVMNSKCIDANNGTTGQQLRMYDCNSWGDSVNQVFVRPNSTDLRLQLLNTSFCLEVPDFGWSGTQIALSHCNDGDNQKWIYTRNQELVPLYNLELCLDISGADSNNFAPLIIFDCNQQSNQHWSDNFLTT